MVNRSWIKPHKNSNKLIFTKSSGLKLYQFDTHAKKCDECYSKQTEQKKAGKPRLNKKILPQSLLQIK